MHADSLVSPHASCNTTLTLILNVTQGSALNVVVPVYYMLVHTIN